MATRTYVKVIDGGEEESTPDLLARNPLKAPLTKTVKDIAMVLGAAAAIFGYVAGAGKMLIKWAGIATVADIQSATVPILKRMDTRDELDATSKAATNAKLDAIKATADTTSAAVARVEKHRRATSQPRTRADE